MSGYLSNDERGQAYIAESLIAILLLSAVLLTAATTLGAPEGTLSVEDEQKLSELESDLDGVVDNAMKTGTLKASLLNWNIENQRYDNYRSLQSGDGTYLQPPEDAFGESLREIDDRHEEDISVAVEIIPQQTPEGSGGSETTEPEGTTVISSLDSTTETVVMVDEYMTVYADDPLQSPAVVYSHSDAPKTPSERRDTVQQAYEEDEDGFFPFEPKADAGTIDDGDVWNTYRVRVIAWY